MYLLAGLGFRCTHGAQQIDHTRTFRAMEYIRSGIAQALIYDTRRVAEAISVDQDAQGDPQWIGLRQTAQGLRLLATTCPDGITTPCGEMSLYRIHSVIQPVSVALQEKCRAFAAFKQFAVLEFIENAAESTIAHQGDFGVMQPDGAVQVIAKHDLDRYRGTDAHIIAESGHTSFYKIRAVNGISLPELEMRSYAGLTADQIHAQVGALRQQFAEFRAEQAH